MTLVRQLRAKGHEVKLGSGLKVVVRVAPGADAEKAREWVRKNEQMLRLELVSELQVIAGVRGAFPNAVVRKVRSADGKEVRGEYEVRTE